MRTLNFSRDGILRVRQSVYDRSARKRYAILLPVAEVYGEAGILPCVGSAVEFEEGIDVRETLLNLAPFSDQVSALAHCRFDRFLDEVRKPLERDPDDATPLGIMGFTYSAEIGAVPAFEELGGGLFGDGTFERVPGSTLYSMVFPDPVVTDRLDFEQGWSCAGYRAGTQDLFAREDDNGYSMSMSPLRTWHDLKIVVADHFWIHDTTPTSDYLTHQDGLFAAGRPGVEERRYRNGELVSSRKVRADAPRPTLWSLVLRCLVWEIGFHGDPEETAAFAETLSARAREADGDIDRRKEYDAAVEAGDAERAAEIDAEIERAHDEREAARDAEEAAAPFEEDDLATLARALALMERDPSLVVLPDGLPEGIRPEGGRPLSGAAPKPLGGNPVTPDGLERFLWDNPGATSRDLREGMSPEEERALNRAIGDLVWERRIAAVRYVSNAPMLNVTFLYFATAKGRVEVVAPDGISYAFVHDPLGTWQVAMDEATEADRD